MLQFKKNIYIKKYILKTETISKEISETILQQNTIKIEKKRKQLNDKISIFAIKVSGITKKTNLKNNIYFILKLKFEKDKIIPYIKIEHEYKIDKELPFYDKIHDLLKKEGYN